MLIHCQYINTQLVLDIAESECVLFAVEKAFIYIQVNFLKAII